MILLHSLTAFVNNSRNGREALRRNRFALILLITLTCRLCLMEAAHIGHPSYSFASKDQHQAGRKIDAAFRSELRPARGSAAEASPVHNIGILSAVMALVNNIPGSPFRIHPNRAEFFERL